jgi:AAHS family benzoate transporter-like MFS transporter
MAIRSTGVGFMLGFARIGAISAPIVIGLLVSMELPLQHNFVAIALPSLLAAVTVALIDNRRSAFAGVDRGGDGAADARGAGAVGGRATAQ